MLPAAHLSPNCLGSTFLGGFGSGDLDLRGVLRSLIEVGYGGLAAVELSRDSHRGARAAEEALGHLRRALLDKS